MRSLGWRLVFIIFASLIIATINFFLLHLVPGDLVDVIAGTSGASSPEYVSQLRAQFGLDKPLLDQYLIYLNNLLHLNLGYSYRYNMSVRVLLLSRLGPTALLVGTALLVAIIFGSLLGVLASTKVNTWIDNIISSFSLAAFAAPLFWTGLMAIVLFSVNLGILPFNGFESVASTKVGWARLIDILKHLILPSGTLALFFLATYVKLTRATMLEVLSSDYITTALAKGLPRRVIVWKHAYPNARLPVITMIGLQMGALVGGSVLIETVFGWPGLGRLAFESVFQRDLNVLLGILFMSSLAVLVANLIVDICYVVLDPRIEKLPG